MILFVKLLTIVTGSLWDCVLCRRVWSRNHKNYGARIVLDDTYIRNDLSDPLQDAYFDEDIMYLMKIIYSTSIFLITFVI